MYDFLRKVPLFADLPEADLERLCGMVDNLKVPAGRVVFTEGSPGDRAYVIRGGQVEIIKSSAGREVLLAVRQAGEVFGELALLEEAPRMATARARSESLLVAISKEQLESLLHTSPSAARAMFFTMLARWRSTEAMLRQSEKMAQLGTLTAGVAHELNNPASAVRRGAGQLHEAVDRLLRAQAGLARSAPTPTPDGTAGPDGERDLALAELGRQARERAGRPPELDALRRSEREAEIEAWLEAQAIADAWELAPGLVDLDQDARSLAALAARFGPERTPAVLAWLCGTYAVHNLLAEIGQGAGRMSEIVKALKSYSYLDQAPVQAVDVHEGLESTLLILRHKLKAGISVRREYAADLPRIQGYGSELNQVWTNILDNAADALGGKGRIAIRTNRSGAFVAVEIEDDGPGIPPEVQARMFEPFFTTKPPGQGTGLGLDIAYRIVVQKHRGDIKVFSHPGRTCFQICLPLDFQTSATAGGPPPVAAIPLASDESMRRILETSRTIAVVGASPKPDRPAHEIPAYLQREGYRILPVNPDAGEILGEPARPDLGSVAEPVDVVLVFRRSEVVPGIVEDAIRIGAKSVWMQEGIVNETAADRARGAGLEVVMDSCIRAAHKRLISQR